MKPLQPALGRLTAYLLMQVALALMGLAYLALAVTSAVLLVLIIGIPLALGVLVLGRGLAKLGLMQLRWIWQWSDGPRLAPLPRDGNLAARAFAALTSPAARRVLVWVALNTLLLPVHLLACLLLPVAAWWGSIHPRLMWAILRPACLGGTARPSQISQGLIGIGVDPATGLSGVPVAGQVPNGGTGSGAERGTEQETGGWTDRSFGSAPGSADPTQPIPKRNGLGLLGMSERVAALDGSIKAGPTPGGGFAVEAVLPLEP